MALRIEAIARPNITFLDLDSAYFLKIDPVQGGILYDQEIGGGIELPDTPGLGASIKDEFLESCEQYCVKA